MKYVVLRLKTKLYDKCYESVHFSKTSTFIKAKRKVTNDITKLVRVMEMYSGKFLETERVYLGNKENWCVLIRDKVSGELLTKIVYKIIPVETDEEETTIINNFSEE